ncbi:MAG: NAD(+) synthase [Bacteroidetes bacterium]|nr:NAD(+) synthase [Bacteroidota bacterium]
MLHYIRTASLRPHVTVADPVANVRSILSLADQCVAEGVNVALFPELCLTGYTCADLFRSPDLLQAAELGIERIREWSEQGGPLIVVGAPLQVGTKLYNCAIAICNGSILAAFPKTFLPNSNEYYEARWFASGAGLQQDTVRLCGVDVPIGADLLLVDANDPTLTIGVEICEDLWVAEPRSGAMAVAGATMILNPSASNEIVGKAAYRRSLVTMQSARTYTAYVYASAGAWESTTDTVFSGHCMIAEAGEMLGEEAGLSLQEAVVVVDVDLDRLVSDRMADTSWSQQHASVAFRTIDIELPTTTRTSIQRPIDPMPFVPSSDADRNERCREIITIQATGLAVRLERARATTCVVGLSGGLDSTLALIVCERAMTMLGRSMSDIHTVTMPGYGTTERTLVNARALAASMQCTLHEISILPAVEQHFADIAHDVNDHSVVFENAQARERTQILMDMANQHNGLVIGTADLSEIALGWSTYNADHMSMYAVNAGVPKTLVKYLIGWYADQEENSLHRVALLDILATPISPELLPPSAEGGIAQRTEDVVGPYELHDFFLYHHIRMHASVQKIFVLACMAFQERYSKHEVATWLRVFLLRFTTQQFKRSCMPDTIKVGRIALSPRADWRMPSDASASVWLDELDRFLTDGQFS